MGGLLSPGCIWVGNRVSSPDCGDARVRIDHQQ
jgi:hypothetical protein